MASFQDLPDEIILKVIGYLEIEDLSRCGGVSKRIRKISHEKTCHGNVPWKKRSDMRIKREKVLIKEIVRQENVIKDLKNDNGSYSTENKELQLKLDFVLDENARLRNILRHRDQDQ